MALEIRETFRVAAPVDRVWRFLMDPAEVASCMPGASLDEVVDARTFLGTVRIRLGAISASYKGRVRFDEVDDAGRTIRAVAEGRETGGGTAKGTLTSRLSALPDGSTEVIAEASVDLTGRVVQVGRGMIQGVSAQLFKEFVARVCAKLEMPVGELAAALPAGAPAPGEGDSIRLLPLVLNVLRNAIVRFFRRLLGRPVPGGPQGPSA
ncbi:MAG: carbon monoxide dehydrogenase subunit [Deltaproteobacteria bacterium]|nr:carbon monoxide dehydrogenase subunit [Deltaproteobacteria bacterium]